MDSRMIDVAIGLVLVFALTSLAVTTLHEIWVSMGRSRGRNLEAAIRSLLGESKNGFAERVLAHPLIQSLTDSPAVGKGRPSYISADVFMTALLTQLNRMYCGGVRPATPSAWVAAIRLSRGKLSLDGPEPGAALVDSLDALLDGVESDWDAYLKRICAWYDAVGERSIGWFKRSTQWRLFLLGGLLAMVVNINPLVIAPRLWNDEALRTATVEAAIKVDSATSVRATSASDTELLRQVLAAMQNSADARKATPSPVSALQADVDARLAALERALIDAMGAHRSALPQLDRLEELLAMLPELQTQLKLQRAAALEGRGTEVADARDNLQRVVAKLQAQLKPLKLRGSTQADLLVFIDEFSQASQRETARLQPPEPPRPQPRYCPPTDDPELQRRCELLASLSAGAGYLGLPLGWSLGSLPACADGPCWPAAAASALAGAPLQALDADKLPLVKACLADANCLLMSLLGWSITALATMLGAPFWFDALGKLVKLRAAGNRPTDAAAADGGQGPVSVMSTAPRAPLPADAAPATAPAMRDVQTSAEAQLPPERVREVQLALKMPPERASGFFDGATRRAILEWQAAERESETGELTQAQVERLLMPAATASAVAALAEHEEHVDGCEVEVTTATPDETLPPSTGGVSA